MTSLTSDICEHNRLYKGRMFYALCPWVIYGNFTRQLRFDYPYALHSLSLPALPLQPQMRVTLAMKAGGLRLLVTKNITTKDSD